MAKGFFNYSEQKLVLNNDYLKTVLQELDYEDLHGENAECPYKKPFNKMTNTEQATYMINSLAGIKKVMSDEGIDIDDSTQFSEYPVLLKQDSENVLVKSQGGISGMESTGDNSASLYLDNCDLHFSWESGENGVNLVLECLDFNGNNIPVDLIVKKRVESKGSFDKNTQTLTLKNAYVVDLINRMPDTLQALKQEFLSAIGNKDVIFDLANPVEQGGISFFQANNITTQYGAIGMLVTSSGGTYAITGSPAGVAGINEEYLSLQQMTLEDYIEQMEQQGLPYDLNVFTITGTQGNYDVTFN